jgi:hypothetical protein
MISDLTVFATDESAEGCPESDGPMTCPDPCMEESGRKLVEETLASLNRAAEKMAQPGQQPSSWKGFVWCSAGLCCL